LALIVVVFLIACGIRLSFLSSHFTHVDDIGVANSILKMKSPDMGYADLVKKIHDPQHQDFNSSKYKIFRAADKMKLLALGNTIKVFVCIPVTWTYAPLQFLFTPLFINTHQSYTQLLFGGRFPSFLAFVAAFGLMVYLCKKWFGQEYEIYALLGAVLLALSWENIIYSMQMESYLIGVAALIALIILYLEILENANGDKKQALLSGVLVGLIFSAQYQILLFLPAFFISLFIDRRKNIFLMAGAFLTIFIPIYFLFFKDVMGRSLNWNVGPHNEYLFQIKSVMGLFHQLKYGLLFFIKNLWVVTQSNLMMLSPDHPLMGLISFFLFAAMILGAVSLFASFEKHKKVFRLFFVISLLTWAALIILQKLTLSPTRHTFILQPLMILLVLEGLFFLKSKWNPKFFQQGFLIGIAVVSLLFLFDYPQFINSRRDPFNAKQLAAVLKKYQVSHVYSYDWTFNTQLMTQELPHGTVYLIQELKNKDQQFVPLKRLALLSYRKPLNNDLYRSLIDDIRLKTKTSFIPGDLGQARLIYKDYRDSTVEADYLPKTHNGTNGYFLTILDFK
jgi:hypothetical protein